MPPTPVHEVLLRPLCGSSGRDVIVTASTQDFAGAIFEDLKADNWQDRMVAMRRLRTDERGRLELNQPIHRRFHVALFEAQCDQPGRPRLDPEKITGMGLVLRRRQSGYWQSWNKTGKKIFGWQDIADIEADPAASAGEGDHPANAAIRKIIAQRKNLPTESGSEQVLPLFSAPPEVCDALGKTVLFGLIPVASQERSDDPAPMLDYAALPEADQDAIEGHLSVYLKERSRRDLPKAGEELRPDWNVLDSRLLASDGALHSLGLFLHQAMVELDALGTSAASRALMRELAGIELPVQRNSHGNVTAYIDAASFVEEAAPILVGQERNRDGMVMPLEWPAISAGKSARLIAAAKDCLTQRHKDFVQAPTKFQIPDDLFAVRAFIRTEGHEGCPDRLTWSRHSEYFKVLPWWDGEGPGTAISLPDMSQLKKAKPSVAFAMPPTIANLLKGDMKALGDGEVEDAPSSPNIGWLCSFSIPFITICAFIVLNIFLSLFNIIFNWLLFIKICIPIPTK